VEPQQAVTAGPRTALATLSYELGNEPGPAGSQTRPLAALAHVDDDELDQILGRLAGCREMTAEETAAGLQDIYRRLSDQEWLALPTERRWVGFWPRWRTGRLSWWVPEPPPN
jgi:hypothetical protein